MNTHLICETGFDSEKIHFYGNKFLTGNGYMGVRGTLGEYRKEHLPAINLAGIYDKVGDGWRESVNAPNGLYTYLVIDKEAYTLPEKEVSEHEMCLDISSGILTRKTVFTTPKGTVSLTAERMVSMTNHNLILEAYTVTADYACKISVFTGIDAAIWDIYGPHLPKIELHQEGAYLVASGTTQETNIGVTTQEEAFCLFQSQEKIHINEDSILHEFLWDAEANVSYRIEKKVLVSTSRDTKPATKPQDYETEKNAHIRFWNQIADDSYFEIMGDERGETALNYSLYHLNCIAPRHSESLSIPARGLSGQVYKGAVFWDTEMFMLDYFLYTYPDIAKTLLKYRIDTLPGALEKAKSYGLDGAFYAWESHEGGLDACSDYNIVDVFTKRPMRTFFRDKQVHISGAIVYALKKYLRITGETDILTEGGEKVILACAEFYRSLLLKRATSDFYEIYDVVGPDEYHERVNNNAYTNRMAKFVFDAAYELSGDTQWQKLSAQLIPPKTNQDGVIEQFDGYFKLEDCRVADVRSRLLDPKEYWGGAYGVASDTQVIKQADVVAMMCMFREDFSKEQMKANIDYYEPRTEHGSSLSACMYSLLSCYTGHPDFAYPFFLKSAEADILPGAKQWIGLVYIGGTHPAAQGGAWIVAAMGFAGLQIRDSKITCNPQLPKGWNGMKFKINYRGKQYEIIISGDSYQINEL